MLPLISIIIPTYNRSHLLGETLDTIIAQTYINWECIVVDDGSGDYTRELMELYTARNHKIFYYQRPVDRLKGANSCRNYGFEKSVGQYINWFDDDDLMHPEKLQRQLTFLEETDYSFCVCQTLVFKEQMNNLIGSRNKNLVSNNPFFDYLTMKIGWLTQPPLWKRNFLEELDHLFDEELQGAQEWEFHLRILNKYPEYGVLLEELVFLRKHEESITHNVNEKQRFFNYFLARLKIYKNTKLLLSSESEHFLREYLLNSFKKMIITKNSNAIKAYKLFILPENDISFIGKVNALFAIFAFKLFNKGNIVLQKIKYK